MRSFSRRSFIKLTGVTAAAVAAAAGTRSLLDSSAADALAAGRSVLAAPALDEKWVRTTCALCPSGCGLEVRVVNGRAVKVEGSAIHPVNQGVCCLRAQASLEMLYSPERIERPRVRNGSKTDEAAPEATWREVSWDEALALVAGKLSELRNAGQEHTVAFLHSDTRGSMRATIERFMTAYGSPNAISMDSAGEQAARTAMFLSQGINGYPVYDLNNASYAMAFGGNLLESSRHVITALAAMAFMRRGRPQRGKFVAVHPRLSLTGVKADEWVPIRPGTYAALALGMANVIINSSLYDAQFVRDYTFGFEDFTDAQGVEHMGFKRLVLEHYPLEKVEFITGVPAADIARLAGEFATNRPAVAIMPLEPDGLDLRAALAVHALNALVGSIDVKGGVLVQRFPDLAPWPDDPLPASTSGAASTFPYQPRVDAVDARPFEPPSPEALAARLASNDPYPVNALFLYNANPVYESPADGKMAEALLKIPFVVSFASTPDESAAHADVILPASTFLEIWGDDFVEGVGYPGASIRRPVVDLVHDTRNPGDVLLALAAALGGVAAQALPFADYKALCEHRLSAIDTDWAKFDENGVWSEMVYFNAQPGSKAWSNVVGRERLNAPKDGRFDFFSREMLAVMDGSQDAAAVDLACLPGFDAPAEGLTTPEYPFMLVTQGLITQPRAWWGIVPTLQESYGLQSNMKWNTWVEISPSAAAPLGLADHDRVWVESPLGRVQATVRLYKGMWPNAIYLPPGQGHRTGVSWGRGSAAPLVVGENVNRLLASQGVTRVRVYKI